MDCPSPEVWVAWLEGRRPSEVRAHLVACPDCRGELAGWAEAAPVRKPSRTLPYGIAAAALLTFGAWAARGIRPPAVPPSPPPRSEASLEVAPGGDATLSDSALQVRAGACWLDTRIPVNLSEFQVRFEAGTEAEVRVLAEPKAAWSLLREAWAASPRRILVRVVSGCAVHPGLRIPAGRQARIPSGAMEPLDAAAIDAWRSILHDEKTFSVEVRNVTGNPVLSYPAGETTLGDLPAFRDGAWHRISVTWRGFSTEVFLDGRRILKRPGTEGPGTPGLSVRGGAMERRP